MEAIGLAVSMKAELILMDEARGRRAASEHFGLRVTGTVGILDRAARVGLIDVADVVERLRKTSFRASPKLYQLLRDLLPNLLPFTRKTKRKQGQTMLNEMKEVVENHELGRIRQVPGFFS